MDDTKKYKRATWASLIDYVGGGVCHGLWADRVSRVRYFQALHSRVGPWPYPQTLD